MALQITPQLEKKIDRMIAEGRYANASELMERAVELLEEHDEQLAALREKLQIGLDDIERGREIEYSPAVFQRLMAEAKANARMGKPIDDDVRP